MIPDFAALHPGTFLFANFSWRAREKSVKLKYGEKNRRDAAKRTGETKMIGRMMIILSALLLVLANWSDRANAVTFSIPNPAEYDFGPVQVGSTATFDWSVTWANGSGEDYYVSSYVGSALITPFLITNGTCTGVYIGGPCTFTFSFTPASIGSVSWDYDYLFTLSPRFGTDPNIEYSITLRGTGVDAVATPLPGALPLFAGGLGVIGLLGWKKKRKTATTNRPA
jgi:hypothetical protein